MSQINTDSSCSKPDFKSNRLSLNNLKYDPIPILYQLSQSHANYSDILPLLTILEVVLEEASKR